MPEESKRETAAKIVAAQRLQHVNLQSVIILKEFGDAEAQPIEILPDLVFLNIQESIGDKVLSGTLAYNDIRKVFDLTPFTGNELVIIDLESRRSTWSKRIVMKVLSVVKKRPENNSFGTVTMTITDMRIMSFYNEFSTSFSNTRISDFIRNFAKYNFGMQNDLMVIDETEGNFSFAFPYQKFVFMLKYLNKFAVSAETQGSLYHLYSTLYFSGMCYRSLTTMLRATPAYAMNEVFAQDILLPDVFWQQTRVSNLDLCFIGLSRGFGSTHYSLGDDKTFTYSQAKYSEVIANQRGTGSYGHIKQLDLASSLNYYEPNPKSIAHKNKILEMAVKFSDRVVIRCKGSVERMCGEKVTMKFLDRTLPKGNYDIEKSGDYLIESINHIFAKNSYDQNITMFRIGSLNRYSPNQVEIR